MIVNDEGVNLKNWKQQLEGGEKSSLDGFFQHAKNLNLRKLFINFFLLIQIIFQINF